YVLSSKKEKGELRDNDFVVKTIVTSNLMTAISDSFDVKHYETLTGFKFIGEIMTRSDGKENYLVGGEESYGFLVGDLVRDKDAVNACAFIEEMTAYYKKYCIKVFEIMIELY